jgi:hypothetical protein
MYRTKEMYGTDHSAIFSTQYDTLLYIKKILSHPRRLSTETVHVR